MHSCARQVPQTLIIVILPHHRLSSSHRVRDPTHAPDLLARVLPPAIILHNPRPTTIHEDRLLPPSFPFHLAILLAIASTVPLLLEVFSRPMLKPRDQPLHPRDITSARLVYHNIVLPRSRGHVFLSGREFDVDAEGCEGVGIGAGPEEEGEVVRWVGLEEGGEDRACFGS